MRILLFGAGVSIEKIIFCVKKGVEIIGILDNDAQKCGKYYKGISILSPSKGIQESFDYIVITVKKGYEKICEQLGKYGIDGDRIMIPYSFNHDKYSDWREVFNIEELIYLEMNQKLEELSIYVQNLKYELAADLKKEQIVFPKILSAEEAVKEIVKNRKSMSRYGDGEFDLILEKSNSFQKSNRTLTTRLREILISNLPDHIVAIPDIYGAFYNRTEEFKSCFRRHLSSGAREQEYTMLDLEKVYYDAFITRPYKDFVDRSNAKRKFDLIKTIWRGRDLTIIEGEKSRLGMGNDLFSEAGTCMRILCPPVNAFDRYEEIFDAAINTSKDRLVLIALGATATVLAYDLARIGYQALDIGHIDIEYEWFLHEAKEGIPIQGKYVNEAVGGRIVSDEIMDDKYQKEICKIIR